MNGRCSDVAHRGIAKTPVSGEHSMMSDDLHMQLSRFSELQRSIGVKLIQMVDSEQLSAVLACLTSFVPLNLREQVSRQLEFICGLQQMPMMKSQCGYVTDDHTESRQIVHIENSNLSNADGERISGWIPNMRDNQVSEMSKESTSIWNPSMCVPWVTDKDEDYVKSMQDSERGQNLGQSNTQSYEDMKAELQRLQRVRRAADEQAGIEEEVHPATILVKDYSRFCHICTRKGADGELLLCANQKRGICRKVICKKCCDEVLLSNFESQSRDKKWTCTHCRQCCPPRAQCFTYGNINKRRKTTKSSNEDAIEHLVN